MTIVERIQRMLENEEQTRARCRAEVTVDPVVVTAEIRAGCLRDVLRVLEDAPERNQAGH